MYLFPDEPPGLACLVRVLCSRVHTTTVLGGDITYTSQVGCLHRPRGYRFRATVKLFVRLFPNPTSTTPPTSGSKAGWVIAGCVEPHSSKHIQTA